MAECTHKDLRKARESAGYTQWKLANELSVSETTIKRWESGEGQPTPDDVDRIGELANMPDLWHRWMLSNCDSYRKRYMGVENLALPISVFRTGYALKDLMETQEHIERDVSDGKLDDVQAGRLYRQYMQKAMASMNDTMAQLPGEEQR